MYKLLKEFLSVLILKNRMETLRQVCYDAIAYSVEMTANNPCNEDERLQFAVAYLKKVLPGISDEECDMHLKSIQAKLLGVGADPFKSLK